MEKRGRGAAQGTAFSGLKRDEGSAGTPFNFDKLSRRPNRQQCRVFHRTLTAKSDVEVQPGVYVDMGQNRGVPVGIANGRAGARRRYRTCIPI
jgi:hypothetical protein